jgi:hypothetical protein
MSQPGTRPRARVGDKAWKVDWVKKLGLVDDEHPEYGCDPDRNVVATRAVHEVLPLAAAVGGPVAIWPVEFVPYDEADAATNPHAGFWEDQADAEYFEGDAPGAP